MRQARWAGAFYALGCLVLTVAVLRFGAPLLIPIGVAVLLAFLLSPAVRALERWRLPRLVAVGIAVLGVVIAVLALGWTVSHQANQLLDAFPRYEDNLRRKLALLRSEDGNVFSKLREVARKVDREISGEEKPKPPTQDDAVKVTVVKPDPEFSLANLPALANSAAPAVGGTVLCIALLAFMLMRREDLRERVFGLVGRNRMPVTTRALDEAWERITRTLLVQFGINAAFGIAYGAGLYVIDIPFAVLWGLLAIALRYVPFVGSTLSLALPLAVSVLMMQGWEGPLMVVGWFCLLAMATMAIEAWVVGPGIGVSPAATLVMLGFWTWLWGPIALVLATPLTACLMVLARAMPQFRFVEVALGNAPAMDAPARLYQRLLSRDTEDAQRLFEEHERERGRIAAYDELLLPAVLAASEDRMGARISSREFGDVMDGAAALAEAQSTSQADVLPPAEDAPPLRVLCLSRGDLDRVGFLMVKGAVDPASHDIEIGSGNLLLSETIAALADRRADAVCIGSAPPGGMLAARLVCRQLRRRFPGLPILLVRWGGFGRDVPERAALFAAGASSVHGAVDEVRLSLVALRAATPAPVAASPVLQRVVGAP